ncbi:MAG TPA: hypothetical protein VG708_02685 [Mycobacteriales bacterium]|nr:hypothetical protein [Mycobacteriales bacterium]
MRRQVVGLSVASVLLAGGVAAARGAPSHPHHWTGLRAGAATVDATWHVGASAGQYAATINGNDIKGEWDPNVASVLKRSSYGVASRLSMTAIVLQDGHGDPPIALVRDDNYLAQDMLVRRVGQILAADHSPVTYDHILLSASHDHSSPYYSTPAAGVWLFQDVMDLRMFEYQARRMATAIERATARLRPARLGAATVGFRGFQGNIAGAGVNEDGSPTGYPLQDNDHQVVVMRIDDMTQPSRPRPLATWVNYAEHGESLDEYDLISEDWMAPFARYVTRATHAPVAFSQGSVGSAEGPYEDAYPAGDVPTIKDHGDRVYEVYGHMGYAQAERGAHLLAERVLRAWRAIGGAHNGVRVAVPWRRNPRVTMLTRWFAGPLSHPYPSVGNCRTGPTLGGDPGVPAGGLPDCQRTDSLGLTLPLSPQLFRQLKRAGAPIPDNYDVPSVELVEENLALKLQAVRIGSVLLASCACEPQSDLVKALETRTDRRSRTMFDGFNYASQADVDEAWPVGYDHGRPRHRVRACYRLSASAYSCPDPRDPLGQSRLRVPTAAFRHMEAEVSNDAAGWNALGYVAHAGSEPVNDAKVKGNFTAVQLGAGRYAHCSGYALPVGLGHTGDYNGYTVSYREYEARDSYRKALTSYGPHTADYMVTNLVAMAAQLKCGTPVPAQPTDVIAVLDQQRATIEAALLGRISSAYYDGWSALIPNSAGPARAVQQPHNISRFDAATFSWVGGDNWTDNPAVIVQRRRHGRWTKFADQSGEVQVVLDSRPALTTAALQRLTGHQRWQWTASMEAFDAYPRADVPGGQTPSGRYRFVVRGHIHQAGKVRRYRLRSRVFTVSPWRGIHVGRLRLVDDRATLHIPAIRYPRLPVHVPPQLRFYRDDGGGTGRHGASVLCKTCTFRPWATRGHVASVRFDVVSHGSVIRRVRARQRPHRRDWTAHVRLPQGAHLVLPAGGVRDQYGETNHAVRRA